MGSYKEIYEIEFITRTKQILEDYHEADGQYKLTLLINCLVGLIFIPDQRKKYGTPPLWKKPIVDIPIFQQNEITPLLAPPKFTLEKFVKKLRNGVAHHHIVPINKKNSFTGIKIWDENKGEKNFELDLSRKQLYNISCFIVD